MARHHLINGIEVPFTAEEEAARDAEELAYANSAFDRAMADLRQRRNRLLLESDWTMLVDTTLTNVQTGAFMQFIGIDIDEEDQITSGNPAIFETQPKERVDLDIYYEASDFYSIEEHGLTQELPWSNCFSFGNGLASPFSS